MIMKSKAIADKKLYHLGSPVSNQYVITTIKPPIMNLISSFIFTKDPLLLEGDKYVH